tara:strand:+ start:391 stop:1155 length:765 start_codon:yes stop_codon:yes gene_type:complete
MNLKKDVNDLLQKELINSIPKLENNPIESSRHSFGIYNIFVINLKRRPERLLNIEKQFNKLNIKYKIFWGWDAKTLGDDLTDQELKLYYDNPWYSWTKDKDKILGRKGCTLSHIKCLNYAILCKLDNILIIEDDVEFKTDLIPKIPDDAVLAYLGGYIINKKKINLETKDDWILINNFLVYENTAIIIPTYEKICKVYNLVAKKGLCPRTIDGLFVNRVQKTEKCYILNKKICKQNRKKFESDITFMKKPKNII